MEFTDINGANFIIENDDGNVVFRMREPSVEFNPIDAVEIMESLAKVIMQAKDNSVISRIMGD